MNKVSNVEKTFAEGKISEACGQLILVLNTEEYQSLTDKERLKKDIKELQTKFDQYLKDDKVEKLAFVRVITKFSQYLLKVVNHRNLPFQGFKQLSPKEAIELASEKIENAQWMKVIGSGRQHFAENSETNEVLKYYQSVENKLTADTTSKKPFFIRRITQHQLQEKFQEHLRKCFAITSENKNSYEVVFYGKLIITNTFYVIKDFDGKSYLFLTLNADTEPLVDNVLVFYSEDESIVNHYQNYFDQFWRTEGKLGRIVESYTDFKKYIPFNERLYDKYNDIKNFIKRVPNESARMQHLEYEINQIHSRLEGLSNCNLTYSYAQENKDIITWFERYMDSLQEGKSYRTVSLLNFWMEISSDLQMFMRTQERALFNGAKISRVFFVDTSNLNLSLQDKEPDYDLLSKIIKLNYEQSLKHENYDFNVLFSSITHERAGFKNFAIWHDEKINYKVLFNMSYGDPKFRDTKTDLTFANYNADEHFNATFIDGYETMFEQNRDRAAKQIKEILDFSKAKIPKEKESKKDIDNRNYLMLLKSFDINVEDLAHHNSRSLVNNSIEEGPS